jgi:hypothetical protein
MLLTSPQCETNQKERVFDMPAPDTESLMSGNTKHPLEKAWIIIWPQA